VVDTGNANGPGSCSADDGAAGCCDVDAVVVPAGCGRASDEPALGERPAADDALDGRGVVAGYAGAVGPRPERRQDRLASGGGLVGTEQLADALVLRLDLREGPRQLGDLGALSLHPLQLLDESGYATRL